MQSGIDMKKYIQILRPANWSKNLFVFAALFFGRKLIGPINEVLVDALSVIGGFICFSLADSAATIFDAIIDKRIGSQSPARVSLPAAALIAVICAAAAVGAAACLVSQLALIIVAYLALSAAYTLLLKRMMIIDAIAIAVGFVLRAMAGAVVIGAFISPWLVICTFALCLFMGFAQIRGEVAPSEQTRYFTAAHSSGYSLELLGHMLDVAAGLSVVCFLLYTLDERTVRLFGTDNLVYTTPIVLYCVFRFSALIQSARFTEPVEIILKDAPFQIGVILWILCCGLMIYAEKLGITAGGILAY